MGELRGGRPRRWSREQEQELWTRRRRGESLKQIAAAMTAPLESVRTVVAQRGGVAPRPRPRAVGALSAADREEISRGLAAQQSLRAIARTLGRPPSTVSREIARNGGRRHYRATTAEAAAWRRAERPKPCWLAQQPVLCALVAELLMAGWSPAQISGWLRTTYPNDCAMYVSPETIYRSLYVQARGAVKKELAAYLRRHRAVRRSRHATGADDGRGRILDAVSIAERPASAADRAVPGHWEGDLLAGAGNSYIATLVERRSRFVLLVKVPNKDTASVTAALIRAVRHLPEGLMLSLTVDRGREFAQHHRFTLATDAAVYFCDPQSPWQRGSNENTNGLLRQYFPHGMDLNPVSQLTLDAVAHSLNTRPRKTLGFHTPAEVLADYVASTG